MHMGRIDQAKLGQKEARLDLQAEGQRLGGGKCLFQLEARVSLAVNEQRNVRFRREIGIHSSAQRQFQGLERKAVLARVMPATLKKLDTSIIFGRPTSGDQEVRRDIDKAQGCPADLP